eukprot:scaffold158602_cov37-Tisochrysis_lutea.AAC.3
MTPVLPLPALQCVAITGKSVAGGDPSSVLCEASYSASPLHVPMPSDATGNCETSLTGVGAISSGGAILDVWRMVGTRSSFAAEPVA